MAPRNRPSAFDVSFPEESTLVSHTHSNPGSSTVLAGSRSSSRYSTPQSEASSSSTSLKRPREEGGHSGRDRSAKRIQRPAVDYFVAPQKESPEVEEMEGETDDSGNGGKPIRDLSNFAFFDPNHQHEFITLDSIEKEDGSDRAFEGAGFVSPHIDDEDEGQEDDNVSVVQYVKLGAILRYWIDYSNKSEPFYIETQYAWYILHRPSTEYHKYYEYFYRPRRVAQLVVATALQDDNLSYNAFTRGFKMQVDILGRTHQEADMWNALDEIHQAVEECGNPQIQSHPLITHILQGFSPQDQQARLPQRRQQVPRKTANLKNIDNWVLKPENQNKTHVTPLIASLARGFVQEQLQVVGPHPPQVSKEVQEARDAVASKQLKQYVESANRFNKDVDYRREDRVRSGSSFVRCIKVDGTWYNVGDYILVQRGPVGNEPPPPFPEREDQIPSSAVVADFFWFARIIWIDYESETAHIQWLEHGSTIMFEELAHPQELFLDELCDSIALRHIVAKITVHCKPQDTTKIPLGEYFYRFIHDIPLSAFRSLKLEATVMATQCHPPDNCAVCLLAAESSHENIPLALKGQGNVDGIAYMSTKYHLDDFVLYRAQQGPANIGQIIEVLAPSGDRAVVKVKCIGRVMNIPNLPDNMVRDERHLFFTDQAETIPVRELVNLCYIVHKESAGPHLEGWLALSPYNFYAGYHFPTLKPASWNGMEAISLYRSQQYFQYNQPALSVLDVFGGVGAFGLGLKEGSGCLEVTHAIEIGPSAAKTFMKNSPNTKVINQCANLVLQYAIKRHEGHTTEALHQLYDKDVDIPTPPSPGEIDVITAGFPCQTHSGLNMYKVANDIKSNLILNALSWVDFLKPKYVYFENVPGFLQFNLNAQQAGIHRVENGIPLGGLKILVRAMTEMGYQCHYALLQAGQYGAPQTRIRFFLVAALDGYPLPDLPQPTHDFPVVRSLKIAIQHNVKIQPIRTMPGTAPHPMVTVDDAIGDLPKFDWKHPDPKKLTQKQLDFNRRRAFHTLAFACDKAMPYSGFTGVPEYHSGPSTSFQVSARRQPTSDLQHYTKCLVPKKVASVITIPIDPNADYRDLPPEHFEYQFANPGSSIGRNNYRAGRLYARLHAEGYFHTTVTNVDPTAKQCRVLHPDCKRMVTVRELARSQGFPDAFVFESITNSVVIMHRQIGNAVAWPVGIAFGKELLKSLHTRWKNNIDNAIIIDDSD